jgi:glycosyltransferase involved in cell wall biosynthesis
MTDGPRPRIAIVAHNAYGAISGGRTGHIGGIEWQTSLTARWLAAAGYPVSLLTWDDDGGGDEHIDGVRVVKICRRQDGWPGLRFLHPRWTGLARALARAEPDVCYQNGAEEVTGQVALWCRTAGRPLVFSSANDWDFDRRLPALDLRSRLLYRHGLRAAGDRIVQTLTQQRMLRENFGLESTVIPMPCPGPADAEYEPRTGPPTRRVLWIARVTRQKRPDRLLEVARLRPDLEFDLVGPPEATDYSRDSIAAARATPNVTVHGPVEREGVQRFYRDAGLLVCTSDYEGFPNTFLEAWSRGVPIVSTFDPDGVIVRHGLGRVEQEPARLAQALGELLDAPEQYVSASSRARRYYRENHAAEAVLPRFARVFEEAAARRGPTTPS